MTDHDPSPTAGRPALNHFLAKAGVAARRAAAELVKAGRVTVSGRVETDPAYWVRPGAAVAVDGKPVAPAAPVAVMLHKPSGWTCTVRDRHAARVVTDLVELPGTRLYPAGRLDRDSEGLLILTNDGDYAARLTHPRHGVRKSYEVTVARPLGPDAVRRLLAGIEDAGERLRAEDVRPLGGARYRFLLGEGRKREIRRMVAAVGGRVARLVRVAVGELSLGDLPKGRWRILTPAEKELSLRPGPP
jgi:23S rRNA pseudouridine2605 synthase